MRFCKLVPPDTFSIVQSLAGKPTHPPLIPSVHCLDPERQPLQLADFPLALYPERSSHLKAHPGLGTMISF